MHEMTKIVCAAFVDRREILLVKRAPYRKWYPNHWDLVGGHVDKGENLSTALVRECKEEVGLTPTSYTLIETIYEKDDPKKKTPFYVYAVTGWTGKDAQLLGEEHSELGWFTSKQSEQLEIALERYRPIIRRILGEN
jgi:8-oxo-dGTP diphosphatase